MYEISFLLIHYFVCQTHVGIFIEFCIFETKICFRGLYIWLWFFCNIIIHPWYLILWLILMIFSWSTTLHWNVHVCWTCAQEEYWLPIIVILFFFLFFFIVYPQSLLIRNSHDLFFPHICSFTPLTMLKTWLMTYFTWWGVSSRKDSGGTS